MDKKNIVKEYTNGEITIVWKSSLCSHSAKCVRGLPDVFNAKASPWVNTNGATTEKMIEQVNQCPSGALSFYINPEKTK